MEILRDPESYGGMGRFIPDLRSRVQFDPDAFMHYNQLVNKKMEIIKQVVGMPGTESKSPIKRKMINISLDVYQQLVDKAMRNDIPIGEAIRWFITQANYATEKGKEVDRLTTENERLKTEIEGLEKELNNLRALPHQHPNYKILDKKKAKRALIGTRLHGQQKIVEHLYANNFAIVKMEAGEQGNA